MQWKYVLHSVWIILNMDVQACYEIISNNNSYSCMIRLHIWKDCATELIWMDRSRTLGLSLIRCSGVNTFNPEPFDILHNESRSPQLSDRVDLMRWRMCVAGWGLTHVTQNLYTGLHTALLTRDQPGTVIHTEHTLQQLHKHRLPSLRYTQTQTTTTAPTIISRRGSTADRSISPALTNNHSPDSTHNIPISQHCTDSLTLSDAIMFHNIKNN